MSNPAPTIPTLAEVEAALSFTPEFTAGVNHGMTNWSEWLDRNEKSANLLERLRDLLVSGDVALLSREDREQALSSRGRAAASQVSSNRQKHLQEARRLLQLDPGPEE